MIHRLFLAFLFAFLAKVSVDAVNRDAPHGHTGKMKPYVAGPFGMKLKAKDEETLSKGNPVMKQLPPDDPTDKLGGKAICVQDVEAPKSAIWRQILDMDSYVGKVMKVKECKNYVVKDNGNGTMQLKTKMVLGVLPGYSYTNFYDHCFNAKKGSVTWSLDYDKTSDFDDVAGHWHVEDHPSKPGCSRLFYACDLKFKNALPKPITNFLQKTALKQATAWVKKESEGNPDAEIPKKLMPKGAMV
jgi:hypothetical protein